jgi:hypothetical protein
MPVSTWKKRDERQYRAILRNCRRGAKTCKRIAAATVNKRRGLGALELRPSQHHELAHNILRNLHIRPAQLTCKNSIRDLTLATRAKDAAEDSGDVDLSLVATETLKDIKKAVARNCRERDQRVFALDGGLGGAEMMNTRGFKDGKRSWIDVLPAGGPRMRVTHEVLDGLRTKKDRHAIEFSQKQKPRTMRELRAALRAVKRVKDRESLRQYLRERGYGFEEVKTKGKRSDEELERIYRETKEAAKSAKKLRAYLETKGGLDPRRFLDGLNSGLDGTHADNGLSGLGSSLALMWAAAGAVALIALSDAQKPSPAAADPARELIRQDLNRARAAQGLPPL